MVRGLEKSHVLHQALWNINIPYTPYIPCTPYIPYTPLPPPYNPYNPLYFISHPKKNQKKIWWNEKKFVPLHPQSQIGRLAQLV